MARKEYLKKATGDSVWLVAIAMVLTMLIPAGLFAQSVPEKLVYRLTWTGISVGIATQEIVEENETRRITSTARSNDWLSMFFPVDDIIESSFDKAQAPFPGLTKHYRMRISEGKHHRDRDIIFEQKAGLAHYHDRINGEKTEVIISPNTYDIYGSFYYISQLSLEVGKPEYVNVLDGKELHLIEVRVLRKEKIDTVMGDVNTIVVQPMVKKEGVFEGKGKVTIWLTDDARRIPVKAQTKVTVGSVTATLEGGNY